jgi:hypothetical protein
MGDLDGDAERAAADVVYQGAHDMAQAWVFAAIEEADAGALGLIRAASVVLGGLRALQLEIRAAHADKMTREETLR